MEKKPVLNLNKVCEILDEVGKQFEDDEEDYDVIDELVVEFCLIKSMERPEMKTEYLYVSKMIWDSLWERFRDYDTYTGFIETIKMLESVFCISEDELESFKESSLIDLRNMILGE